MLRGRKYFCLRNLRAPYCQWRARVSVTAGALTQRGAGPLTCAFGEGFALLLNSHAYSAATLFGNFLFWGARSPVPDICMFFRLREKHIFKNPPEIHRPYINMQLSKRQQFCQNQIFQQNCKKSVNNAFSSEKSKKSEKSKRAASRVNVSPVDFRWIFGFPLGGHPRKGTEGPMDR